ncbi:MAG: hypothetical protein RLZZ546_564 [Bacteroidota bacterium]|jgi:hypothetical protein
MLNNYIKTPEGKEDIKEMAETLNINVKLFYDLYDLKFQTRIEGGRIKKMKELISNIVKENKNENN